MDSIQDHSDPQEIDLDQAAVLWDAVLIARRRYELNPDSAIARNEVLSKPDAFGAVFLGEGSKKVSHLLPTYLLSLESRKNGKQTLS